MVSEIIKWHGIKHNKSQGLIDYAYRFAEVAHIGQVRKYTGEPYIGHPIAVARLVASVTDDCDMIAAALLHDVVEDCGVTLDEVDRYFGFRVAQFVNELTEFSVASDGNRKVRKLLDARYLSRVSVCAQTIKVADLIDNSKSIIEFGGDFTEVYMNEMRYLLDSSLLTSNVSLYNMAQNIIGGYYGE